MKGAQAQPSFEALARMPDEELDVTLGAALVARDTYDDLDVPALVAELDALGSPLAPLAPDAKSAVTLRDRVVAVSERFTSVGFRGNTDDYYDPKNSLLPDVLARKTGIPITLSIVWCAMAKTAGLDARGIAFPGHFLVRVETEDAAAPIVVDPFTGGRILEAADATALLRRALGDGAQLHPSLFVAASSRATLVRLLTNLEATWAKRGDHARAFIAVDRIVTLVPDSARMLRERAALAMRLGANELARADLLRVIELEPQAPDIPHLQAHLAKLVATKATLH
ncbi:MAG: hypothetical protein JWP87_739 [Labilithrix sp.]|nr:hypothetical protein [Labilithrix sp.]